LSLIVPTFNRASILERALASFLDQDLPPSLYEIIVVNNNSSDDTEHVVRRSLRDAPCAWSHVRETRQGLHHACNRGILAARGDIVAFGDDDIVADRRWLSSLLDAFDRDPGLGVVGGRVLPAWQCPPPAWVFDYGDERAHTVFAYLDRGDAPEELAHAHVIGCNFAVRRELALRVGGRPPDTFPDHLRALSGTGETGMIDGVRALGYRVLYTPGALVHHHVSRARMTFRYFVSRYRRSAVENAFDEFRRHGRFGGAGRVTTRAAARLFRAAIDARGKKNALFFLGVHAMASVEAFAQIGRVLLRPALYRHTRRSSYLDRTCPPAPR
jgi:glycosyltransferase involved in cell wall biosynthesis